MTELRIPRMSLFFKNETGERNRVKPKLYLGHWETSKVFKKRNDMIKVYVSKDNWFGGWTETGTAGASQAGES